MNLCDFCVLRSQERREWREKKKIRDREIQTQKKENAERKQERLRQRLSERERSKDSRDTKREKRSAP